MKQGKTRTWNKDLLKNNAYTDPNTNEVFNLSHLSNMNVELKYEFKEDKKKKQKGTIDALVIFDNHCYTKEINTDENKPCLVTEHFNGKVQHRCFDKERFEFSKKLPYIIKNLPYKTCMESQIFGQSIRIEDIDKQNPKKGTYIIIKTKAKNNPRKLTLHVETAHKRNNPPNGVKTKDIPRRYIQILGDLIKNKWMFLA